MGFSFVRWCYLGDSGVGRRDFSSLPQMGSRPAELLAAWRVQAPVAALSDGGGSGQWQRPVELPVKQRRGGRLAAGCVLAAIVWSLA